jgi:exonuclease III
VRRTREASVIARLACASHSRCASAGLQEIKLQEKHVDDVVASLPLDGWALHWNCSADKAGYSGVAIFYRKAAFDKEPTVTKGISLPTHDGEGRVITLELEDLYVVNAYVPNSGTTSGLHQLVHMHKAARPACARTKCDRQRSMCICICTHEAVSSLL